MEIDPTLIRYLSIGDAIILIVIGILLVWERKIVMKKSDCTFIHKMLLERFSETLKAELKDHTSELKDFVNHKIETSTLESEIKILREIRRLNGDKLKGSG